MAKEFNYKVRNSKGQIATGTISAENNQIAALYLRKQNLFIIEIKEKKTVNLDDLFRKKVKIKDLAVFCRQFAAMIDAGMPIVTILNVLVKQTPNKTLKSTLEEIARQVEEGESISAAMARFKGNVFPQMMITMVQAGEVGGVLDVILDRLALQFEKQYKINEKTKSAMTYPLAVMGLAVLAVAFLLIFVLPAFAKLFVDMNVELPFLTRMMLYVSALLQEHYALVLFLLGILVLAGRFALRTARFAEVWSRIILKLPVFGVLQNKVIIARFSRSFATLLRGGVPILVALSTVETITENFVFEKAIREVQNKIKTGNALSRALSESKIFPLMLVQMVAVGEDSGSMDSMLDKVADFYESEVDDIVSRLSSLLEPIMIVFLGLVVGGIVLAVVSPMFDAVTNIGK